MHTYHVYFNRTTKVKALSESFKMDWPSDKNTSSEWRSYERDKKALKLELYSKSRKVFSSAIATTRKTTQQCQIKLTGHHRSELKVTFLWRHNLLKIGL